MADEPTVTSPETPAAAPSETGASTAPSPSSTESVVPSWEAAIERATGAPVTPTPAATPAPAAPSPEPATAAPAALETAPVVESAPTAPKGPIPFERHEAALKNAREKTREEIAAQFQQQYGSKLTFVEAFERDPVAAWMQMGQELQANPVYAPQLASHAARTLASRRGQTPAEAMPEPDLSGQDERGQTVRFYSAEQQAKRDAWFAKQLQQQWQQQIAPLQQDHQQRQAADAQRAQYERTVDTVRTRLSAWRERPGFTANEAAIRTAQAKHHAAGHDEWTAIGLAYAEVVGPWLQAQSTQSLIAEASRKAAASTSHPTAAAPAPAGVARSWDEAFERAGATA